MSVEATEPGELATAKLAELSLRHLAREEAFLNATLEVLQQVRSGLLSKDPKVLAFAQERQEEMLAGTEALRQGRAGFRAEASALLGLPAEAVTLSVLAARLPGAVGEALTQGRQRLYRLVSEIDRLNRSNIALIYFCLDFLDRFFMEITGSEPSGGRYGPAGTHQEAACGSILEARG